MGAPPNICGCRLNGRRAGVYSRRRTSANGGRTDSRGRLSLRVCGLPQRPHHTVILSGGGVSTRSRRISKRPKNPCRRIRINGKMLDPMRRSFDSTFGSAQDDTLIIFVQRRTPANTIRTGVHADLGRISPPTGLWGKISPFHTFRKPSQSASLTALPKGEPWKNRRKNAALPRGFYHTP